MPILPSLGDIVEKEQVYHKEEETTADEEHNVQLQ
jgi:hypothetical protein